MDRIETTGRADTLKIGDTLVYAKLGTTHTIEDIWFDGAQVGILGSGDQPIFFWSYEHVTRITNAVHSVCPCGDGRPHANHVYTLVDGEWIERPAI